MCFECWRQIFGFHNFQLSVYQAQKNFSENCNVPYIKSEIKFPHEKGNVIMTQGKQLFSHPEFSVKSEDEVLPEEVSIFNSSNNLVGRFMITELEGITNPNHDKIDVAKPNDGFLSLNSTRNLPAENIHGTVIDDKDETTISLPKLELTDVYSGDDSSQDPLSDEYDEPEDAYLGGEFSEKDDSTDLSLSKANSSMLKHLQTRKGSTVSLKDSDDFIAQWKPSLQCELCSETCSTYSLLRQHFHDKHPLEKCYIICCQQMFSGRYRIEDHIRLHMDPNAFKCELCEKDHTSRYYLISHMRTHHLKSNDGLGKTCKKTRITDKEMDELIAQWMPNLECVVCKKTCSTLKLLQLHFRQNHPQKQFQIECCQRKFKRRYEIEEHIRLHIDPNAFKCELCYKQFKEGRYLHAHMRSFHSKSNESKRKSAYQKKMTDTEMDELIAHDSFAAQESFLLCVLCSEMCQTYSLLRQHFQKKHPQEKFYILCCQHKFSLRYRIEDHVRLHINPNVFKCDLCDKPFIESRYLLAHERRHHTDSNDGTKKTSNKKMRSDKEIDDLISQWSPNLKCVVCSKTCKTLTLLQLHFRQNHPLKQFQIECCQRMFKRRYEIEEHMRLHIDPDAFKCELCSTRFSMRRNLLQHMTSKHPSSDSAQIS